MIMTIIFTIPVTPYNTSVYSLALYRNRIIDDFILSY